MCSDERASAGGIIRLDELRDICSICHDPLFDHDTWESVKGGVFVLGQCTHLFHVDCIRTWSSSNDVCPLCRSSMTRNDMANMFHFILGFTGSTSIRVSIRSYIFRSMIKHHFAFFFADDGDVSLALEAIPNSGDSYHDIGRFRQIRTHASDTDEVYSFTYHMLLCMQRSIDDDCFCMSQLIYFISNAWHGMVMWGHIFREVEMTPTLIHAGDYSLYPFAAFGVDSKLTLVNEVYEYVKYPFMDCAKAMVELSKELLCVILQHILPIRSHDCIRRLMVDIDAYSDAIFKMADHEYYDLNGLVVRGSVDVVHGESMYTASDHAFDDSDHRSLHEAFQYIYSTLRLAYENVFNTAIRFKNSDNVSWKRSVQEFYLLGLQTYHIRIDYNSARQPFVQFLTHAFNSIHLSLHECLNSNLDTEKFRWKSLNIIEKYQEQVDMEAISHCTQLWSEFDFWNDHIAFWNERLHALRTLSEIPPGHYVRRASVARYILQVEKLHSKLWKETLYDHSADIAFVKSIELGFISRLRNVFLSGNIPHMASSRR